MPRRSLLAAVAVVAATSRLRLGRSPAIVKRAPREALLGFVRKVTMPAIRTSCLCLTASP
jgi:hypothetical protein